MIQAILLCCAMLADGDKPAGPTAADRTAYQAAAAKVGKNAGAHVRLALWCEAHGLTAERTKHLNVAVSVDPTNALARGLLGMVPFQGKWEKPDAVKQELADDPRYQALFREYQDRRVRAPQKSADAQLKLAAWCHENGLKDEAMAHYHLVTKLDPSRDTAWIHLGYKKHNNRWVKPDLLAAQKLEAEHQKHADAHWKLRLEKLRDSLESRLESQRLKAEKELYQITDPRAVPMIWKVFASGSEKQQLIAVELFQDIEGPAAAYCLLELALADPSADVRQQAARAVAHCDPRDVAGWLINLLHKPYKYEVKRGNGPGTTTTLLVDGEKFDLRRLYRFPRVNARFVPVMSVTETILRPMSEAQEAKNAQTRFMVGLLASNILGNAIEQSQKRSQEIEQTLEDDIRAIDNANTQINYANAQVLPLLTSVTGQQFGADPKPWQGWWAEELGLAYNDRYDDEKPSYTETVGEQTMPVLLPTVSTVTASCFAAGTPIQTLGGTRKIETLTTGDRVLSQHPTTGALSFQPVLATTVRPDAQTFRLKIDGETIVATGIHRFWKAGTGWVMARDLKPGDRLRKMDGVALVQSIEPDINQNVYNLSVAENRNFLIGSAGVLVHDVNFVQPVEKPFDQPASPAPAAHK